MRVVRVKSSSTFQVLKIKMSKSINQGVMGLGSAGARILPQVFHQGDAREDPTLLSRRDSLRRSEGDKSMPSSKRTIKKGLSANTNDALTPPQLHATTPASAVVVDLDEDGAAARRLACLNI